MDTFAEKVLALSTKYAVTYSEVTGEIHEAESALVEMIDGLVGDEFDMKGLAEFQSLLRSE